MKARSSVSLTACVTAGLALTTCLVLAGCGSQSVAGTTCTPTPSPTTHSSGLDGGVAQATLNVISVGSSTYVAFNSDAEQDSPQRGALYGYVSCLPGNSSTITATKLSSGDKVYRDVGFDPACRLVAEDHGQLISFIRSSLSDNGVNAVC